MSFLLFPFHFHLRAFFYLFINFPHNSNLKSIYHLTLQNPSSHLSISFLFYFPLFFLFNFKLILLILSVHINTHYSIIIYLTFFLSHTALPQTTHRWPTQPPVASAPTPPPTSQPILVACRLLASMEARATRLGGAPPRESQWSRRLLPPPNFVPTTPSPSACHSGHDGECSFRWLIQNQNHH